MNQPPNPSEESRSKDLTGSTLGDYEIIRRLGRGGMADVYLADQMSLKRKVAIKVLKQSLSTDESYVARFHREAQAAAALVQSNIVQIYEVGEIDGNYFIAQEYVPGRNLSQHIVRYGALDPAMAVNIMRQVAMALKKAGEFNVIHRDIKPENIILSTTGEAKVADFGLARVNDKSSGALTQIGITMGTPLYMSPEQVEGNPVDPRSDIYSLGITSYHMLAGKPPFDGENAMAIAVQHVNGEPESLLDLRPDVPHELISLVKKMTSKAPDDRPENAAQVLKSLRNVNVDSDLDWNEMADRLASDAKSDHKKSAEIRSEAARRLDSAMRGNMRSWWTSPLTALAFLLLGIGGLLGGVYLTQVIPHKPLLDRELTSAQGIPKRDGVIEQYRAAYTFPTEAKWQAVVDLHPIEKGDSAAVRDEKVLYHNYAFERLGELYLVNSALMKDELFILMGSSNNDSTDVHRIPNGDDQVDPEVEAAKKELETELEKAWQIYNHRIDGSLSTRLGFIQVVGYNLVLEARGATPEMLLRNPELLDDDEKNQHLTGVLRPMFEEMQQKLLDWLNGADEARTRCP